MPKAAARIYGGGRSHHPRTRSLPPAPPAPFHLLEVIIVSAQDLHHSPCTTVRAHAAVSVHPSYRARTPVDNTGHTEPFWNHRFIFPIDDEFLLSDTSAVSIEIYTGRHRPKLLGTARLILSSVKPCVDEPVKYAGIQIRRPKSLRPQGILNLGVALLDSYSPLYASVRPSDKFKDVGHVLKHKLKSEEEEEVMPRGRKWEVGEWAAGRERKVVQMKLDKWKEEVSPEHGGGHRNEKEASKKKKRNGLMCCFCAGER